MRSVLAALAVLAAVPATTARMQLINPPEFSGQVSESDYPVRYIGQSIDLKWTPNAAGKKLSCVLYQLDASQAATFEGSFHFTAGPFEFITHDQVDATEFTWIVGTTKDLSVSPLFSIALWTEGANFTDSASNVFSISEAPKTTSTRTSTTTSSSTSTSTGTSTSTSTSASGSPPQATLATADAAGATGAPSSRETTDPSTTPQVAPASGGGGLSVGASAGIGVGAAAATLFGVGLIWCLWRCRRQQPDVGGLNPPVAELPIYAAQPLPGKAAVYYPPPVAVSREPVVEMDPSSHGRYELSS